MSRFIIAAVISLACSGPASARGSVPPGACHAGAYAMSDGSMLVITPSDPPALRYRTLDGSSGRLFPVSAHRYESGEGWSVREPVTVRVELGGCDEGRILFQRKRGPDLGGEKIRLPRVSIRFDSGSVTLFGELVRPRSLPRWRRFGPAWTIRMCRWD